MQDGRFGCVARFFQSPWLPNRPICLETTTCSWTWLFLKGVYLLLDEIFPSLFALLAFSGGKNYLS